MTSPRKKNPLEHLFDREIQNAAKTLIGAVREILDDEPARPAETPQTPSRDTSTTSQALRFAEGAVIEAIDDLLTRRVVGDRQCDAVMRAVETAFADTRAAYLQK